MKNFILTILFLLIPASMLFPQDYPIEYHLNNGNIVIATYISDSMDSVCVRLLNDSIKYYNWNDVKTYYYVEYSHDMKPLRDTAYKLTDTSDIEYTGLVMKDTSNYIIFKTEYDQYRIFRKTNVVNIEAYPVEIRNNWIWKREPCDDRLIFSHNGKIPPAGTFDFSLNEIILMGFFAVSITDWCQVSLETDMFIKPVGINLRFGKELFKNFYPSVGILNLINNEDLIDNFNGKFTYNDAVIYNINTYQFRNFAITEGIYIPLTANYNYTPVVHLFNDKKPVFVCGFNWRFYYNMSFVNENIFTNKNYYNLILKWTFNKSFVEIGFVYFLRGFGSISPGGGSDGNGFPILNFGFSF